MFLGKAFPYTKREKCEYIHEINKNEIIINTNCSDLEIVKSDASNIKIDMTKIVGGESENKLQEELDSIKCTFIEDIIEIEDSSPMKSKHAATKLNIPNDISSLIIQNGNGNVSVEGDFDSLKIELKDGSVFYKGALKQGNIYSDHGEVELDLNHIEDNYNYQIDGTLGDIYIEIPDETLINLTGLMAEKIRLGDGVNLSNSGATFDINKTVDTKKTVAEIKINNKRLRTYP